MKKSRKFSSPPIPCVVLNPAGEILIRLQGLGVAPDAALVAIEQQSPAPAKP